MRPPRAFTRSTANMKKRSEEAPFHCGSLGGKCEPISPSASAPRMRVGQRVQADIGVGMAGELLRVRNTHAAEHDMIAGREGVHVDAAAGAHVAKACELRGLRAREILRVGDLDIARLAFEHGDLHAGPFGERGVVGEVVAPLRRRAPVRGEQGCVGKALRRLDGAQAPRSSVCCTKPCASTVFTVSVTASPGTAAPPSRAASIARAISAWRGEGAGGVMHQHDIGLVRLQRLQPGAHRGLPRGAAEGRRQDGRACSAASSKAARSSGRITGCTRPTWRASTSVNSVRRSMISSPMRRNCLGVSPPTRVPLPAATTTTATSAISLLLRCLAHLP